MSSCIRNRVVVFSLVWCLPQWGFGGEAAKAPAKQLTIRIAAMEGDVEVKLPGASKWTPAKVGMELTQGAEIQTHMFSWVDLQMANNSRTRLDSVTRLRVDKYLKDNKAVHTSLHVRSGAMSAVVNKGKLKADFRISTPRSTASIRGSELARLRTTPYSMLGDRYHIGRHGRFLIFVRRLRRAFLLQPGQRGAAGGMFGLLNALQTARFYSRLDMLPLGSTGQEQHRRWMTWRAGDMSPANGGSNSGSVPGVRNQTHRSRSASSPPSTPPPPPPPPGSDYPHDYDYGYEY